MTEPATATLDSKVKLTPMLEQYRSIKKTLPSDTILFFRLGDFYEMFFQDAVNASEILNITLTGRDGGQAGRVPMCGIPYHSFLGYVRTLVENNLKVAICEQVGDPKASKGLVERKISRIISPSTFLEDDTRGKNPDYLVAVSQAGSEAALSYLELSTGEFCVREITSDRLASELTILMPKEVVLARSLESDNELTVLIRTGLNAGLTVYEDWIFEAEEGMKLLKETFRLSSDKSTGFADKPLALAAAGAVLYFLKDHLHTEISHVRPPVYIEATEFMVLERTTQKSLELVVSMQGGKKAGTLLSTIDQTLTSMGSRTLYEWLTHPLLDQKQILSRQEAVSELVSEYEELNRLRESLKGIKDLERTLSRLNYGVANARDLINLQQFFEKVPDIKAGLTSLKSELLKDCVRTLDPMPELKNLIERAIVEEPPLGLKDGGIIREGFHEGLDELRGISSKGKAWIVDFQARESKRTGIKNLKVKYSQVFGYTLEVSKSNLQLVPEDYKRKQTLANAERFIVPELKEWDEKISGAQEKIRALEYDLFYDIRARVLTHLDKLQIMARATGRMDALASLAITARMKKWVCPQIDDSGEISVEAGRHPVVEAMLPAGKFVENDILLDSQTHQLIVLTGPNMAGKSTYIRQTALIVILAQMGSFVPAASARIGIVDRIFTRIGASDDLAAGESTFMVEMVETAQILQKATSRSLLILDEVGRGTSTFDGVSIAWAICEHLAQGAAKPRTLFATHYHELTQLEEHFPGVKNYNITVKDTRSEIIFLRKVVRGGSDRSYGIHVAQLAGIPQEVIKRAKKILSILECENSQATRIIEGKSGTNAAAEPQLTFFQQAPAEDHPVIEELEALALNELNPLQALNLLAAWKERLKKEEEDKTHA